MRFMRTKMSNIISQSSKVQAVDTTAAGDTFTGYFLAGIIDGMEIPEILKMSAKASSIAVTRQGLCRPFLIEKRLWHPLQNK